MPKQKLNNILESMNDLPVTIRRVHSVKVRRVSMPMVGNMVLDGTEIDSSEETLLSVTKSDLERLARSFNQPAKTPVNGRGLYALGVVIVVIAIAASPLLFGFSVSDKFLGNTETSFVSYEPGNGGRVLGVTDDSVKPPFKNRLIMWCQQSPLTDSIC